MVEVVGECVVLSVVVRTVKLFNDSVVSTVSRHYVYDCRC